VKRVPRGLAAALAISLAAHAAFVVAPWSRTGTGARSPPVPTAIVARVLRADEPAATTFEVAAPPPLSDSVAPVEPRADAPVIAEQSASILQLPIPPRQDPAETSAVTPIAPPSQSASAATPNRADTSEGRTSISTPTAAEPTSGLDRGPQPLDDIEPAIPVAAGDRGGVVTLRLVISDQGAVESIEVLASSPPGLFDAAALAAFGRARFSPGMKGGVPVRSEVRYDVSFAPIGRGSEASGRTY
jgi:TonB family protein